MGSILSTIGFVMQASGLEAIFQLIYVESTVHSMFIVCNRAVALYFESTPNFARPSYFTKVITKSSYY